MKKYILRHSQMNPVGHKVEAPVDPGKAEMPKLKPKDITHDEHGKAARKEHKFRLQDAQECQADISRFCSDTQMSSNFAILDCLQDEEKTNGKVSQVKKTLKKTYVRTTKEIAIRIHKMKMFFAPTSNL